MKIVMRDPATLKPYENNPKEHPPGQITAIAQSITNFGFDQPVVVDQNDVIVKGHGRTLAAIQLGLKSIPVIVTERSKVDVQLNRILDNHLTSRDYEHHNLSVDLTALDMSGVLASSLYSLADIPQTYAVQPRSEASLFSLVTKHKCPSCNYRW